MSKALDPSLMWAAGIERVDTPEGLQAELQLLAGKLRDRAIDPFPTRDAIADVMRRRKAALGEAWTKDVALAVGNVIKQQMATQKATEELNAAKDEAESAKRKSSQLAEKLLSLKKDYQQVCEERDRLKAEVAAAAEAAAAAPAPAPPVAPAPAPPPAAGEGKAADDDLPIDAIPGGSHLMYTLREGEEPLRVYRNADVVATKFSRGSAIAGEDRCMNWFVATSKGDVYKNDVKIAEGYAKLSDEDLRAGTRCRIAVSPSGNWFVLSHKGSVYKNDAKVAEKFTAGSDLAASGNGSWYAVTPKGAVYRDDSKVMEGFPAELGHRVAVDPAGHVYVMTKAGVCYRDGRAFADGYPAGTLISCAGDDWFAYSPKTNKVYRNDVPVCRLSTPATSFDVVLRS